MKRLFKYLKNYRRETVLAPLFKLCEAVAELFVPLVIAAMIDNGIRLSDKGFVLRSAALLAVLGLVGFGLAVTAQYFAAKAAVGFAKDLRFALFEKIQKFSYSRLDGIGISTLITRMTSDIDQIQAAVNLTLRLLLRSPFIVFGAAIMAFTVDPDTAVVFVIVIPLLAAAVFGIMLVCLPMQKKIRASLDKVLSKTRENLLGVRVIRAFCKEKSEVSEFDAENENLARIQKFTGRISSLLNPLCFLLVNLFVILLIYKGALRVEHGMMTQGAVVAMYNYMSQILVELIKLANLIINVTKGIACGNRVQAVLDSAEGEPKAAKAAPESGGLIEFRGVSFRYDGAAGDALCDISFKLGKGETLGVIGGTGSGKTTLVNLLAGFYRATGGKILIRGENVDSVDGKELRKIIGLAPQKAVLFSGTLRENLCWRDPGATDDDLLKALETARALDIVGSKDGGLDCTVEPGGVNFSGGQRQRLAVARALVGSPEILILDDSASALDFATEAAMRKALKEGAGDRATVIVSQRTSSIAHADRILVLNEGRQVGLGTHGELLENCEVYREIYESQFKKEAAV